MTIFGLFWPFWFSRPPSKDQVLTIFDPFFDHFMLNMAFLPFSSILIIFDDFDDFGHF